MKKIDRDGLLLCELQATAFENSIDKMDSSSEIFIRRFMKSNIAKRMDDESILESNLQANDILQLVDEEYGVSHYGILLGDLHQALGDDGTGKGGAQQIVLVLGTHHHRGDDHVVHHLVGQVLNVQLGGTGLDGLLLQTVQLAALAHVGGDGDDLGVIIVLLQPGDDDGSIQTAGIGEHYFFHFSHDVFPP